jgi:Prolyl oligopeptidase family
MHRKTLSKLTVFAALTPLPYNIVAALILLPVGQSTYAQPSTVVAAQNISPATPQWQDMRAEDLSPYLEFKSTTLLDWHPITRQALVRTEVAGGKHKLQIVEGEGGKLKPLFDPNLTPTQIFPNGGGIGQAWFEPKVGRYIVFEQMQSNGVRLLQLDISTESQNAITAITTISPADQHAADLTFNREGNQIAFTTQQLEPTKPAKIATTTVYLHSPLKPDSQRILATLNGSGYSDFKFAPDGKSLVYVQTTGASAAIQAQQSLIWVLDIASGTSKRITPLTSLPLQVPYLLASPRYSEDGKSLYLLSNIDSDFKRLIKLDIATGKMEILSKFAFDIDEFLISVRQNRVALITNEQGGNGLRFLDLTSFKELPRPPLVLGEISGLRWRGALDADDSEGVDGIEANKKPFSAKTVLGFTLASARGPLDVFSVQVGGRVSRWSSSASVELNPMDFVEPQSISWKSFDETTITGFYYAPDATKFPGKRSVIIKLHDDNQGHFKPGFIGRDNYFINVLGIAVIYPNIRGSSGFGKAFFSAGKNGSQENAIKDIGALLAWVATQPALDPERIMLSEASAAPPSGTNIFSTMTSNVLAQAIAKRYADKIATAADIKDFAYMLRILPRTHDGKTTGAELGIRN